MNESTVHIVMKAMLSIQNTAHSRRALRLSQLVTLKMRFTILLMSNYDCSCCSTIKIVFLKDPHCTFDIKVLCCLCVRKEMLLKKKAGDLIKREKNPGGYFAECTEAGLLLSFELQEAALNMCAH